MDRIDYLKYLDFPISSETLSLMQDTVTLVAKLSSIGGSTYILDGCEVNGDKVSAGTLVINGEIIPYEGGLTTSKISIQEVKENVQVYEDLYQDVYVKRKAVASSTAGALPFSGFSRLPNLQMLASSVANIDSTLTRHINNHRVDWGNVDNKPNAFPPVGHSHDWSGISGKPSSFPPAAHTHAGGPVFIGWVGWQGGPAYPQGPGMIPVTVVRLQEGYYKIVHNLGHVRYIILGGSGVRSEVSIRGMYDIKENDCIIVCSDDSSENDCNLYFTIITM